MSRPDVYTAVHKMQRAHLFELTMQAGKADPSDAKAIAGLAAAVEALAAELVAHAQHEERFIHPLLRARAPGVAEVLEAAHLQLDARLDQLRHVAVAYASGPDDPNMLYRALAAFTSTYLDHLATEESQALPALWQACSDEELVGILVSFKGSRSEPENLTSLLAQLATLNPPEIVGLVTAGLTVSIPEITELLSGLLDPHQLGALRTSLEKTGNGEHQPSQVVGRRPQPSLMRS